MIFLVLFNNILVIISIALLIYVFIIHKKVDELQERGLFVSGLAVDYRILMNYKFYSQVHDIATIILNNTSATRFLILYGINGNTDIKYATVFFEAIDGQSLGNNIHRYNRVIVDDEYRKMIAHAYKNEYCYFSTDDMNESVLKHSYSNIENPKIQYSIVKFLNKFNIRSGHDLVLFSSVSTAHSEPFTTEELEFINKQLNALKPLLAEVELKNDG